MSEKAAPSRGKRLGRRIVLVIILALMVVTLIALIAAPFLPRLLREGTPQARWHAPDQQVIVGGALTDNRLDLHGICTENLSS